VADDLGREAVAGVTGNSGRCHRARLPGSAAPRKQPAAKLTVPAEAAYNVERDPQGSTSMDRVLTFKTVACGTSGTRGSSLIISTP